MGLGGIPMIEAVLGKFEFGFDVGRSGDLQCEQN